VSRPPLALVLGALLIVSACGSRSDAGTASTTEPVASTAASTTLPPTTAPPPSTTTSTTTTTTTTSTTTTTTAPPVEPLPDAGLAFSNLAFDELARQNPAAAMTVIRDGRTVLSRASGTTIDGAPATSDSPMVVASVSKLLTALMIARLAQGDIVDVNAPVPWADMSIATHPDWVGVTVRELLDHTSGMPVARSSWFDGGIDCGTFLPSLLDQPPTATRGRWTYSNGNYCALGVLIGNLTWLPLGQAAQAILFDPLELTGVHLTTDGQLPTDVGYPLGVERLSRLGGAGTFLVSTDDVAAVLANVTPADLDVLRFPGLLIDQYGWGHTGSVDSAVSCAWVLEGGRTVVSATVAGKSPGTGGGVCDRVVPAVAADLGFGQGRPDRSPP